MTDALTRIPVELSVQFNKIVIDMKAPVVHLFVLMYRASGWLFHKCRIEQVSGGLNLLSSCDESGWRTGGEGKGCVSSVVHPFDV